jgi:hypothetical protein
MNKLRKETLRNDLQILKERYSIKRPIPRKKNFLFYFILAHEDESENETKRFFFFFLLYRRLCKFHKPTRNE